MRGAEDVPLAEAKPFEYFAFVSANAERVDIVYAPIIDNC